MIADFDVNITIVPRLIKQESMLSVACRISRIGKKNSQPEMHFAIQTYVV